MEYCPHGTLFNRILKHPLTPKEIISYIHQIIHILKILHTELHIIHRDLNLANFLIGKNNQIKLTDFGFSVKMSEVKEEIIGPAYYMPPESQEPTEPSDKWDIYSLGILLFEMMQHVRPALPLPKTDEFFLMLQDVVKERYDGTLTKRFYCYGRTYEDVKPEEPFLLLIWNMLQPSPTNRPSILDVKQRLEGLFGIPPTTTRSVSGGGPSK
jgi:serine/threonine protein kinase